jgi:uncharacterized protein YbjT (DUF2867 family)
MLIIGATGGTGRHVVTQALELDEKVRVLVRRPEEASSFEPSVEVIVGDVLDPVILAAALEGESGVISALGVRLGEPVGTTRSVGTSALMAAMISAGVSRIVEVSAVGVGSSRANQTLTARLLWPSIVGKERLAEASKAEDAIAASTLEWTVIRAPRLIDGQVTGRLHVGVEGRLPLSAQVTRGDLASALLTELRVGRFLRSFPSAITPAAR